MAESATARVYEHFPFPSPRVERPHIELFSNEIPSILTDGFQDGWTVLDAGCGTGHTIVGMAKNHPGVNFVGLEPNGPSRAIAQRLVEQAGITNIEIVDGKILGDDLGKKFDFIYSYGVVHHIPDPPAALRWLSGHLAENALMHIWLYDTIGEAERMRGRALVQLLNTHDGQKGLEVVRALGLKLSLSEYGIPGDWDGVAFTQEEQDVFDADAYLNPVVHTMRISEATAILTGLVDWVAADRVWGSSGAPCLDLYGVEREPTHGLPVLRPEDLFDQELLRERIGALSAAERAALAELAVSATGFNLLAGRGDALSWCTERIKYNRLT